MTTPEMLSVFTLGLFSLADLRYRMVPGVSAFFLAAVWFGALENPLRVALVVLVVGWGWLRGFSFWVWPALLHPSTWMVSLFGAGVRRGWVGASDLLALAGLACLFDWYVPVFALLGVEGWRRWWNRRQIGKVPALPGMFLGLLVYLMAMMVT